MHTLLKQLLHLKAKNLRNFNLRRRHRGKQVHRPVDYATNFSMINHQNDVVRYVNEIIIAVAVEFTKGKEETKIVT